MSLLGALDALTDGERARHPGSLAIQAYFDGRVQAAGGGARMFPRFLTRDEEDAWREGWTEARAEQRGEVATVTPLPVRRDCSGCVLMSEAAA